MSALLSRSLERLVRSSNADAAIIWSRSGPAGARAVVCAHPDGLVPSGMAWPPFDGPLTGAIHRDSAALAGLVPTSARLRLRGGPRAALSMDLADGDLALLMIWCDSPAGAGLSQRNRRLIAGEITELSRLVAVGQLSERVSQRLLDMLDNLKQGVVSVDHALDQATVNRSAATLLNLPHGEVRTRDFAAAMAALERRALEADGIRSMGQRLLAEPAAEIDCVWRLAGHPTHLRVSSRLILRRTSSERIWVFDDVSVAAQALEDATAARGLLQANADSMRDPQVSMEAVRDANGAVADFVFCSVNRAACIDLGLEESELVGRSVRAILPDLAEAGLLSSYLHCLETGEPLRADGFRYGSRVLGGSRRYDFRAARAGADRISLNWTDVTERFEAAQRIAELAGRLQRSNDRIAAELGSAAAYMFSIMPRGLAGRVEVSSRYLPSAELGGDCFDYTWIDDDHLMVYLIDVSGHGLGSALLSVSVHNMLRSGAFPVQTLSNPGAALSHLNRLFQMDRHNDLFFTIWLGVYQASTRTLRYASAGATPAYALAAGDEGAVVATELRATAVPVGMFEDTVFASRDYRVPPGCRLLVYSDGASEIDLADGRQMSPSEFKELTVRIAGAADFSLDVLLAALRKMTPAPAFEDDCSLILLRFA